MSFFSMVYLRDLAKCLPAAGMCGTAMSWFGRTGSLWWRSGMTYGLGVREEEAETGQHRAQRCYWAWGRSQVMTPDLHTDIHKCRENRAGRKKTQLWDHLFIVCLFVCYPLEKKNPPQIQRHKHAYAEGYHLLLACFMLPPKNLVCLYFPLWRLPQSKALYLHIQAIWLSQS